MKKRILVIDDEQVIRESLQNAFHKEGYDTESVSTIRQAVDKVAAHDYDLITCDVMIPALGGLELVEQIKADPDKRHIPILIITGMDKEILEMTRHEGDAVMTKPFETKQVLEKVKQLLQLS